MLLRLIKGPVERVPDVLRVLVELLGIRWLPDEGGDSGKQRQVAIVEGGRGQRDRRELGNAQVLGADVVPIPQAKGENVVFGLAVVYAARSVDAPTVAVFTGVACVFSLGISLKLNFRNYTDEDEPYVYVQTLPEINALLDSLKKLVARDPENYFITGHFVGTEQYPFCWLLADYPLVDYLPADAPPEEPDADFLVVDDSLVEKIEPKLHDSYLRVPLRLRGAASESEVLYLNPGIFAPFLPQDTARFTPGAGQTGDRKAETGEKAGETGKTGKPEDETPLPLERGTPHP